MKLSTGVKSFITALTFCGLLTTMTSAAAVELSEVENLMRSGDFNAALGKAEAYAKANPADPAGRFSRGLILVKLNRVDEAINVFNQLTADYPNLPEPYNNLAVLHAQRKDFDKAQQALQAAIATNPSYATAHENLGDIFAIKAASAYSKALEISPENRALQGKLQMLERLNPSAGGSVPTNTTAAAKPPVQIQRPITIPPKAEVIRPTTNTSSSTSRPTTTASTQIQAGAEQKVRASVEGWARAWSNKDLERYLGAYSVNFEPEKGTYSAWKAQRRKRLNKPGKIQVTLSNIDVQFLDSDIAWVSLVQDYKSANYQDQVAKTLLLEKKGGGWKIVREEVLTD